MICWRNKYLAYLLLLAVLLPSATLAADEGFVMIVGVPGLGANNVTDTSAYFAALYNLTIWIAAFLAVVKIMLAGVKYMFTDLVDAKAGAKKDIQGALLGLVIVLAAVLILNTINPDLTNFTLFENVPAPIVNPVTPTSSPEDQETLAEMSARELAEAECLAKGAEGFRFKLNPEPVCCIPGGTGVNACADDGSEISGVMIDPTRVYSTREYQGIIRDYEQNGNLIGSPEPINSSDEEQTLKTACESSGNQQVIIQRNGPPGRPPVKESLCIKP